MSDLDTLQLHIKATDDSTKVLATLATNLRAVGSALNTIKTTNIDHLAQSLQKIQDINKLSGASTSINEMVKAFASVNNIDRKAIPELTAEFERLFKALVSGNPADIDKFTVPVHQIAANNIKLRKEVDETDKTIAEYFKAFSGKVGIGDLRGEFGDSFKDFLKMGKGTFVDALPENGLQGIEGLLQTLQSIPGAESKIDFSNVYQGAHDLYEVLQRATSATYTLNQALGEAQSNFKTNPADIDENLWTDIIENQYKGVQELSQAYTDIDPSRIDNYFGNITPMFEQLKGVMDEMPDFTPIRTLASSIATLGSDKVQAGVDNIPVIAESLKSLEGIEINSMDGLKNIAEVFQSIPKNISKGGSAGISNIVEEFKTAGDAAQQAAQEIETPIRQSVERLTQSYSDLKDAMGLKPLTEGAFSGVNQQITDLIGKIRELKQELADMDSGKTGFDVERYQEAQKEIDAATNKLKELRKEAKIDPIDDKSSEKATTLLVNLMALGHEIETLANGFKKLANIGTSALKAIYKPMDMVVDEFKEKAAGMTNALKSFSTNAQAHLKKFSDFWKRTMRTFTFMLVRKAITAVIKDIKDAVDSLAQFESAVGGSFNDSISNAIADFSYIGRAIVGAFEPIINVVIPILDALAAAIARVMALIGHFFAALTGQGYYVTAKKNVTDYAASLDKASKSQKNLTMGIDELNILNENKGGSSSAGANPMDEWDMNEVEGWMKDFADKVKDLFDKIFNPFKEAWDNAKDYVISGFKLMVEQLKALLASVGRDFLKVWNQDETIAMLTNLFKIIGDIERIIANLAKNFREAWDECGRGLRILENIRDIFAILVQHMRNVTQYMVGWSKNINFKPLLSSIENLTSKLKRVAEFVGGVFEDIFKNIILPYIKWFIEDGIPHTLNMIAKVIDAFNFTKIREELKPVEVAFEKMLENIHTGVTNAIGNLGLAIAKWTNSQAFTDFMEAIAHIMGLITADRVEKLFTALGLAILKIAEALAKFVSSEPFLKFLDSIAAWFDSISAEELANVIVRIAGAIALFSFAGFVGEGIAGFFQFLTMIKAAQNIGKIATELGAVSKSLVSLPSLLLTAGAAFYEFYGVTDGVKKIASALSGGSESIVGALAEVVTSIGVAATAFTAVFGFPAGLIIAGIAACIEGVVAFCHQIDEINFDRIGDAITQQGETTISQVKEWYSQATDIVSENIQKWKDSASQLAQDRDDIHEFTEILSEFGHVFENTSGTTAEMADMLVGKYKQLGEAINTYIDDSTDAIVTNLLAQREYLIAQGVNVDQMIVDIYRGAEEQKKAVSGSLDDIKEIAEGFDGLTEGSKEWIDQSNKLAEAANKTSEIFSQYDTIINSIDTTEATRQIKELGESLDLSEYVGNPEAAINAIKGHIDEVKAVTVSKIKELKDARDAEIAEVNANRFYTQEQKDADILTIKQNYKEIESALYSSSEEVLNFYSNSLATQMESVANQASSDWDAGIVKTFLQPYSNKEEYILNQMYKYNQELVEQGVGKSLQSAYDEIPNAVEGNVVDAMGTIVNSEADAYREALYNGSFYNDEYDMLTNVLGAVDALDYTTPADKYATQSYAAFNAAMLNQDYQSLGKLWNEESGGAILSNSQIFADKNKVVAGEGAAAFSQEYVDFISGNQNTITALENATKEYGGAMIEGLGTGIEESADENKSIIDTWFKNIDTWIHDNPFMPFGSPNQKTMEYGGDLVEGLNKGIDDNKDTTTDIVGRWFENISNIVKEALEGVLETITLQLQDVSLIFDEMSVTSDTQFRTMAEKITTVFVSLKDGVTMAITTLATTLSNTYSLIVTNTQMFVESVHTAFMSLTTGVAEAINNFTVMLTEQFTNMTTAVIEKVVDMEAQLIDRFTNMKERLIDLTERIRQELTRKWENIRNDLQQKMERIKEDMTRKWEDIERSIEQRTDKIQRTLENKWNSIKQKLTMVLQELKRAFETNFDAIEKKVNNKCEKIIEHTNKVGEKFKDFANDKLPEWKDAWKRTWDDIKGIVNEACSEIISMVNEMVMAVQAAFEGLGDALVWHSIVPDMWNEIERVFGKGADSSLAEVNDLAEDVADSFEDMADILTNSPLFDSLVDGAASAMDATVGVVEDSLADIKSLFDTSLSFPDVEMPTMEVNTDWASMPQSSPFDNEAAMSAILTATKGQVEGISNDAIRNAVSEQSDQQQRLFNQMIDLLGDIARKDTNVYMDSRSLVSGISNRQRRNGYDFRMA